MGADRHHQVLQQRRERSGAPRRFHSAAAAVTQHEQQRHPQDSHREFQRPDRFAEGGVAGAAHLVQLTGPAGEQPGRIHPRIGTAQQGRERSLALGQGERIDLTPLLPDSLHLAHPLLGRGQAAGLLPGRCETGIALLQALQGIAGGADLQRAPPIGPAPWSRADGGHCVIRSRRNKGFR